MSEGGWRAATIGKVAKRVGISTGAIYRYFPSKSVLHARAFERIATRERGVLTTAFANPHGTPVQRLHDGIERYAMRALQVPQLAYSMNAEPALRSVEELRLAERRIIRSAIRGVLEECRDADLIPEQDLNIAAGAITGIMNEALMGSGSFLDIRRGEGVSRDEAKAQAQGLAAASLRSTGARIPV